MCIPLFMQGGTQVFAAPLPAVGEQQQAEGQQPAAKKPKRVVPELIGAGGTGGAGGEAGGQPAAQAAGQPKAPKRITPIPVAAPQQQEQQEAAAVAAPSRPTPTESGSAVGAASKPAGAKRITPTPIKPAGEEVAERFENAKQVRACFIWGTGLCCSMLYASGARGCRCRAVVSAFAGLPILYQPGKSGIGALEWPGIQHPPLGLVLRCAGPPPAPHV